MNEYPHLVVRVYSAVYMSRQIRIFRGVPKFQFEISDRQAVVYYPTTYDDDGILVDEFKKFLITALKGYSRTSRFYVCVVWSPNQTTYVEPNGTSFDSDFIPQSGI